MAPKDQKDQYDYLSPGDRGEKVDYEFLMQKNNEARIQERDQECRRRESNDLDYDFNMERMRIRDRYDKNWDYPGMSTHHKTEDGLI